MNATERNRRRLWLAAYVLTLAALLVFPRLDILFSSIFFDGRSFPLRYDNPVAEFVRLGFPRVAFGVLAYLVAIWFANELLGERWFGLTRRVIAYLVSVLLLGPGLIVNLILKDNWGRARPSTIQEFGGERLFTPAWMPSGECDDNCSFVSGHAALAFWGYALALLAPVEWRGRAVAAALIFGMLIGLARISQGGHFLSDVLVAGLITVGVSLALHRLFFKSAVLEKLDD